MPGLQFSQGYSPNMNPVVGAYLLAGGSTALSGTGTPPAASLQAGDIVVLTTKSTLTASSVPVVRMLLAADKTAHYKEGTPVAGILGVLGYPVTGNGSGQVTGAPAASGLATGADLTPNFASLAQGDPQDSNTNRTWLRIMLANEVNTFRIASLTTAATPALIGTQIGLTLSTTSGVTTYSADTSPGAGDAVAVVTGVDSSDLLYGLAGGHIYIKFLPSFCQIVTGVNYSTQ